MADDLREKVVALAHRILTEHAEDCARQGIDPARVNALHHAANVVRMELAEQMPAVVDPDGLRARHIHMIAVVEADDLRAEIAQLRGDLRIAEAERDAAVREAAALREQYAWADELVQCPCEVGHVVFMDDGDGGVFRCPVCVLAALRAGAEALADEWAAAFITGRAAAVPLWERVKQLRTLLADPTPEAGR